MHANVRRAGARGTARRGAHRARGPARFLPVAALAGLLAAGCGGNGPTGSGNRPPQIAGIVALPTSVVLGGTTRMTLLVSDPDNDVLHIDWTAASGRFSSPGAEGTDWTAPDTAGVYTLFVSVSDGTESRADSARVRVGQGSVTVISDPPGAYIALDGFETAQRAPHTFDPLAVGDRTFTITSVDWRYDHASEMVTLEHGDADTVRFRLAPVSSEFLTLGRNDLAAIGGVAYLHGGTGVVYAARLTDGTTGIFNSTLSPRTGTPNGILLASPAKVDEPVTVSGDGSRVVYVGENGGLFLITVTDPQGDGLVDEVTDLRRLGSETRFSPSLDGSGRLAFSITAAGDPEAVPVLWGDLQDSVLADAHLAAFSIGKLPSFQPGGEMLAFIRNGVLLAVPIADTGPRSADTLSAEGYNTAPTWGPWGPMPIAVLTGEDAGHVDAVRLAVPGAGATAVVFRGLDSPAFPAWSPSQEVVAVSENAASGPRIRILFNLPIP